MENRKRKNAVLIRFSDEEFQHLNDLTGKMKVPRETFIRGLVSGVILKPVPTEEMIEYLRQIRYIGNNINQLAIIANKTGNIDMVLLKEYYSRQLQEIADVKRILQQPLAIKENICQ